MLSSPRPPAHPTDRVPCAGQAEQQLGSWRTQIWAGGEGRGVQLQARSDGFPQSINAAAVHGLQTQGVLAMGAQSNCYTEITAKQVSV